jgi:outer membrane receptor protein involved in Fe transport
MFLINGHRTGTGNATQIPLVNVERIEILRGPEMLRYTAASPGGVINVVTKKGGPEMLGGSVEAGYGSFDMFKGQLKLNGAASGFDYSLGYSYQKRGDYKDGEGYTVKHTGVAGTNAVMAELGYSFNEHNRLSWSMYYYDVDKAEKPAYSDPTDPLAALYANATVANRRNISNTLSYDGSTLDNKWVWNLSFTFGENLNEVYQINPGAANSYPMASSFDRQLAQGSLTWNGDITTITGGVDYLYYETGEGAASNYARNSVGQWVFSPGKPLVKTGSFENLAGYLTGNVRLLNEKLIFSAALRYDYYKVEDKRTDPQDYQGVSNPNVYGHTRWATSQTYSHLSPSLGVSFLPWEYLKLRANWTHSFRPPSPRELFSSWYESYGFWGYPWNKAENTDSYEFGFDINDKYFTLSATYFYSITKDYVYQHQDPIEDRQRVRNSDKQRRMGIELNFDSNVSGALGYTNIEVRPYFSVSYLIKNEEIYREGADGVLGRWTNTYANWIPKMSASYGLIVKVPSIKLSTNLNFSYWGKVYPRATTMYKPGPQYVPYDPDVFFPGFTVVNFTLRKGLVDFDKYGDIELKLDATNIFNKLYAFGNPDFTRDSNQNFYMPGRSIYAGVVYNF